MSLFDSIVSTAATKFGLGDKAGDLLSALLAMITNSDTGGFSGFLDLFNKAGLSDTVTSWISSEKNSPISGEQLESALGTDNISSIANQAGIGGSEAKSALAFMIPMVIDKLTPDGVVPGDKDLLSGVGDAVSGMGAAAAGMVAGVAGTAGAVASGAADKAGEAAGAAVDTGKKILGGAVNMVDDVVDGNGSVWRWLLPLILLLAAVLLGSQVCSKPPEPVHTTANANKGANTNTNATANANKAEGERKLAEVMLPDGKKLEAYPDGIEDQLVKFIQSDEYKNTTPESLKEKWFNFDDLNFKFGTAELAPESKRQLDNIVAILKAFPDVKMKIGGYSDKKGDDAQNLKLSDTRAKAVKAALEKAEVGAQVPEAEGYGEKFATVAETASDDERKVDRKTAVRLIKGDANAKPAAANANTAAH